MNSSALWKVLLLVFPYLGLRKLDPKYSVEIGCVVEINNQKGPNYTADAGIWHAGEDEESDTEIYDEMDEMEEDSERNIAVMVQV